jgi:PAS domain S-box-containing protein
MRRNGGRFRVPRAQPLPDDGWRLRHGIVMAVLLAHAPVFPLIYALRDEGDAVWTGLRVGTALVAATAAWFARKTRLPAEVVASLGMFVVSGMVLQQAEGLLEAQFHFLLALVVLSSYQSWTPWLVAVPFFPLEYVVRSGLDLPMFDDQLRWTVLKSLVAWASLGSWWAITATREDAEQRISDLTLRYELIIESAGEGIFGLDLVGRTTFVNAAAAEMLGWARDDLIGRNQHATVHHSRPDGTHYPFEECPVGLSLRDGTVHRSATDVFWRRDGSAFPVEYISTPIEQDGRIVGAVVTFADITDRLRAEATQLEVVRLQQAEAAYRQVLEQLQDALRPPTPTVQGLAVGVCYLPADPSSPTGGDLYDLQVLPDGSLHVAVVDVQGKGVEATKDALAVTYVLRSLVLEGHELSEVLARTDRLVSSGQHDDVVATVLAGRYDPATGKLALAGAGHPPALLIPAEGQPRYVDAPGSPIGWPLAGSTAVAELVLGPGDTLLLYTDGLVEGNKDIVRGMEALAEVASTLAALDAERLAAELVGRTVMEATRRDDTLALVLRRTGPG